MANRTPSPQVLRLAVLFGLLYFVQGVAEPTEGLIAQPVRSLLGSWNYSAEAIGSFAALISLPWNLKPIFGLISDFVPLFGSRRKSWLLLSTVSASCGLFLLYFFPTRPGSHAWLLLWMIVPTVGVAMSDVVIDALMVEKGQPLGITGRLQSVQWAASYTAMIITGSLGGWLAQQKLQDVGFLICGLMLLPTIGLVLSVVDDPPATTRKATWSSEWQELIRTARHPTFLAIAAFLLLLNFNPFSSAVLHSYMTNELQWSESFYGHTVSLQAIGAVIGSIAFGFYCQRVSMRWMVHLAIVQAILATAAYWLMTSQITAMAISVSVGFTFITATLVQLDLAARICPPQVSATVFATLMAVTNIGLSLSYSVGGYLYDHLASIWDRETSFQSLVAIGVATTALSWLLAPILIRQLSETRESLQEK